MKLDFELDGEPVSIDLAPQADGSFLARIGERELRVTVPHNDGGYVVMRIDGVSYRAQVAASRQASHVALAGEFYEFKVPRETGRTRARAGRAGGSDGRVSSPMPGKVVRMLVEAGATVEAHQGLLILEAMKMENEIRAPRAGKVARVHVKAGQMVMPAELLVEIE